MKEKRPWERLPEEDDEAWKGFQNYLAMSLPRRIPSALARGSAICYGYARQFNWKDRARAYDDHQFAIRQEEKEAVLREAVRDVSAAHMITLKDFHDLVSNEAKKWLAASRSSEISAMKPGDLARLLELVIKCDRLVRDQATEISEQKVDYSKLSLEELELLEKLEKKAAGEGTPTEH